jgi:RNA polymerase sigma factor (sigma-70 family)
MEVDASTGDSEVFAAFVALHRADLVRAAERIVGDRAEAEDVVQDTLVALWRHWQDRRPDDPAAYAFRAVSLNAIKHRTRRRRTAPLETAETASAREAAAAPIDSLEFERAIARLPVAQQVVVRMRFYLGYSLAQISRSLSISSNTAASRCRYALAALRNSLKGHWLSTETQRDIETRKDTPHGNET